MIYVIGVCLFIIKHHVNKYIKNDLRNIMSDPIANTATAVTAVAAIGSWTLTDINTMVSIIAGCVAIISGSCAAIYYIRKILQEHKQHKLLMKSRK